jgi:hypothetical protein
MNYWNKDCGLCVIYCLLVDSYVNLTLSQSDDDSVD